MFYGFGSTAIRDAPYSGIYLLFYEKIRQRQGTDTVGNAVSAATAGFLATAITQPFDVIRTKIQLQPQVYKNTLKATRLIYSTHGVNGFISGLSPRLARKTLSAAITWTVYEELVRLLSS